MRLATALLCLTLTGCAGLGEAGMAAISSGLSKEAPKFCIAIIGCDTHITVTKP